MMAAQGEYVLFTDADNSTPIEELKNLMANLENSNFQVAVGSRAAAGSKAENRSLVRQFVSGGLRRIVQVILHLEIADTQCGFKLYTRQAARLLHGCQTLNGFSFDLELLYLARKFGFAVVEVPVKWIDAPGSKVDTFKEIKRFFRDMLKIRINDWGGLYETAK